MHAKFLYQGTCTCIIYTRVQVMLICIFAAVGDLRKEIKTEENPAYATTLQVSLHTDNSITTRFVICLHVSAHIRLNLVKKRLKCLPIWLMLLSRILQQTSN